MSRPRFNRSPLPADPDSSRLRSWLAARTARQVIPVVVIVVALVAGLGGYYLAAGHSAAASPGPARSSAATPGQSAATSSFGSAPASGTRVCGEPVLRSPYTYAGGASSFSSGEHGLPTYGAAGSDFPGVSRGVIIQPCDNTAAASGGSFDSGHTLYYFVPGRHVIQTVMPTGDDSVYLGGYSRSAGEAVIDGVNGGGGGGSYLSSSTGGVTAANQTWEYLTIKNYGASENNAVLGNEHGAEFGTGDTYRFDTIGPNDYGYNGNGPPAKGEGSNGGYAIGMSGDTTIEYNCLTHNAQGAFNGTGADDVVSHNEISWNAIGEYPDEDCGCSGGGKLFFTVNADVTDNYVHDNYNTGIWLDFDNTGANISGNYVSSNWGEGIEYEASYNARISDNTLAGNGWASDGSWPSGGKSGCYQHVSCTNGLGPVTGAGGNFPYAALYLPNSGGNASLTSVSVPGCAPRCHLTSRYAGRLLVEGNALINNFGEIMVYTATNRYPGNLDGDSSCSIPLGALDQPNSSTYYLQTNVLTSTNAHIAGTSVTAAGGLKALCAGYGGDQTNSNMGNQVQAPSPGMAVFNLSTGAMIGTIGSVASASSFTLTAKAPSPGRAQILISAYGGCGPADYYHGGPAARSGKPVSDYWLNCIWGSRNVTVSHNIFSMNTARIRGCTTKNMCGYMGLLAFNAGVPALMQFFHAYPSLVAHAKGGLGNVWSDNAYTWQGSGGLGSFGFWAANQGTQLTQAQWQAAPYGQDAGSTFNGTR